MTLRLAGALSLLGFLLGGCAAPAGTEAPAAPVRAALPAEAPAETPDEAPDARQIHWQRSLEDALALARAEDRPLLVAQNMDGESASDRIVLENYRDPAFVAATREFVCVVGTVFRHGLRDHDDQGRRIPCPRLGELTCGEHVALEPLLFERFLSDGERVAPRHALVLPEGTKAWDIALTYDLRDIDRAIGVGGGEEGAREEGRGEERSGEERSQAGAWRSQGWAGLAACRDARGRERLEEALAEAPDAATVHAALAAIAAHGDAGALEGLRVVAARLPGLAPELRAPLVACARALGLEAALAEVLRARLQQLGEWPWSTEAAESALLLPLLAELDGKSARTRSFLLASFALAENEGARAALEAALGSEARSALVQRRSELNGAVGLAVFLAGARAVERSTEALPRPGPLEQAMPEERELEDLLAALEPELAVAEPAADALARYAKAALDLGRRRIESRGQAAEDLLEDAARHWERALALEPEHVPWWLERARTAWTLGRFEESIAHARHALLLANGPPVPGWPDARLAVDEPLPAVLENALALEALRWIGDGHARLLGARSGGDPVREFEGILEGLRALTSVAASAYGTPGDWRSLASFLGALGLWREELALAHAGATRFPAAQELRQSLNAALWNGGRIALAPRIADVLAEGLPSGEALWFAGHAWLLAAEDLRRGEQPERALGAYAESRARFQAVARARPEYAASAAEYLARGWLGSGQAEVRCGRRAAAADALVEAVRAEPALGARALSDGLGYDVLDLVDKLCEWRAAGPSDVDPFALLARLEPLAPGDPFWAVALSDSQLREALRADGRNPERALRDTVDAAGLPIRMLMGLPNAEGDAYLERALALARRALPYAQSDEDEKAFTQAATIWAERMLERGRLDGVRAALAEAAPLLGAEPPPEDASLDTLRALAAELRAQLGEARPRWRAGR